MSARRGARTVRGGVRLGLALAVVAAAAVAMVALERGALGPSAGGTGALEPGPEQVVLGRVYDGGQRLVPGALVVVRGIAESGEAEDPRLRPLAAGRTDAAGEFRFAIHTEAARFLVEAEAPGSGRARRAAEPGVQVWLVLEPEGQ